jgi:hypothetical protein
MPTAFLRHVVLVAVLAVGILTTSGCGGGGDSSPPPITVHAVTISWAPNHEAVVNSLGGGYIVNIGTQTPINVPYVSGLLAPTFTTVSLSTGTYTVSVVAYSALNPPGGISGSTSAPSAPITLIVP